MAGTMRRAFWLLLFASLFLARNSFAAESAPDPKGLWLVSDYPSITLRAGESSSIALKLRNAGLPPQRVLLAVEGVPAGWKATLLGGGSPVAAAMADTNDSVALTLKLDIPGAEPPATHDLSIKAGGSDFSAVLPIAVTVAEQAPPKLSIKTDLPALRGSAHSNFDYQFTVRNDGEKDVTVALAAEAPSGFQTSFTEGYGSQEITSIPIPAGQAKDLKIHVQPPQGVAAGDYAVRVHAAAPGLDADTTLAMQITGEPKVSLSTADGRLSAPAEAGKPSTLSLIVANDGGAPARNVEFSSSAPSDWRVTFEPKTIALLAPGDKQKVQAVLTPPDNALAGDYMANLSAASAADASSADIRVTVATSTLWGIAGIGIIAVALLVALGAVIRFGRR